MKYRYHEERKDTMRDGGEFTQQPSVRYPRQNTAMNSQCFLSGETSHLCSIKYKIKINVIRGRVLNKYF